MGKGNLSNEVVTKRVAMLKDARDEALKNVDQIHVKLQRGNRKTGPNCWTTSFLPVIDCGNCDKCKPTCYDFKSNMFMPAVIADRARNSAIHKADPERYWKEVDTQIKANFVQELRINVGGDLNDDDFAYVAKLGRQNKGTMILFFTKNYKGINKFLEHHKFPTNVKPIMIRWEGMSIDNPYKLPEAHVLYEDGRTTAPEYGAVYCGGNCSECAMESKGCWNLKKGQHVIFKVH